MANVHGPQAGIEAVERIENGSQLKSYYLLYAVLGEFEKQLNNFQAAIDNFRKALELTELTSEQLFLSKRLRDSEETSFASCRLKIDSATSFCHTFWTAPAKRRGDGAFFDLV